MNGNMGFVPLLFGGDINVYGMARAFHEAYGLRAAVRAKFESGPCCDSRILAFRALGPDCDTPGVFVPAVCEFAAAHADKKVLLLGCGDSYVRLAAAHRGEYPPNVVVPYIDEALMDRLTNKERFYALCDEYAIPHPMTFIHRREMGHAFELPFPAPYIVKPSNGVLYWEHPFSGNEKVFLAKTREALHAILDRVYASGYSDSMVLQEFIPGDDTAMRVLTCYSGRDGRVKLSCLGHVLLEEHSPHGIGNHAVIVNEADEALSERFRAFLDALGYVGFSNFDIKHDARDGTYKVFELNARQGRSNYYVTGAGYNLARCVAEDYIFGAELSYTMADAPFFWHVVPMSIVRGYIAGDAWQARIRALIREGRAVNPMVNPADAGLRRRLRLWRLARLYKKQYPLYMERRDG